MNYSAYIGSYASGGGYGIYRLDFDPGAGAMSAAGAARAENPSYLLFSADRTMLYAVNESDEWGGEPGGGITAYSVGEGGSLAESASRPTGGSAPCHLGICGGYLFAANYGDGTVSGFPLGGGVPGPRALLHRHEGSGPDRLRQGGPHAHCVAPVPGSDEFCVVDLGIDQARFYRVGGTRGAPEPGLDPTPGLELELELVQAMPAPPGSGPRHVVFSPCGRLAWLVTELSNEVCAMERGGARDGNGNGNGSGGSNGSPSGGGWRITHRYSALPAGYAGASSCAAIRRSPDGKLIAASNRGHDSVAVFSADEKTGALEPIGIYPTGGKSPRDIAFTPDGKWLLAANQDSDLVTALSVDGGFGLLELRQRVSKPVAILF
ncbi:MAG: lactonase family protein [Clostridiales bacterium]|jgi:6-phosphogluconolactonase|nr:lactonase family protein [Clostridiales bacterium]